MSTAAGHIPVSAFAAPAIAFEATIWLADIPEPPDKLIPVWAGFIVCLVMDIRPAQRAGTEAVFVIRCRGRNYPPLS